MMYRVLPAAVATLLIVLPLQAQQPFSSSVLSDGESSEPEVTARASSDQETPREIERAQHYRLALDEFLVLVPLRLQDDIQADIDESRRDETRAKEEKRKADDLERLARDQLDAQKE